MASTPRKAKKAQPLSDGHPNNRKLVDALKANLDDAFTRRVPENVRSLIMLSGGVDSVALLANTLSETTHKIHAHHIEIVSGDGRDIAETEALDKVIDYCRANYRDFDYTTSKSEFDRELGVGLDLTLTLFTASRVFTALGGGIDIVFTGHMALRPPQVIEGAALFGACFINKKFKPKWLRPLAGLSKADSYESIPQELAKMTWSCQQPMLVDETYRPCGKCPACQSLAKAVVPRAKGKRFVISPAAAKKGAGG